MNDELDKKGGTHPLVEIILSSKVCSSSNGDPFLDTAFREARCNAVESQTPLRLQYCALCWNKRWKPEMDLRLTVEATL